MATGGSRKERCLEATCSICLEYFIDPVTTRCGHNFCRACLTEACGKSKGNAFCPLCREPIPRKNLRQNHQLGNLIELVQELQGEGIPKEKKGLLCTKHQEPLKLYCRDHEALICVVCDRSKEHREHQKLPADEAAEVYKIKIQNQQDSLEKKGYLLLGQTLAEKQRGQRNLSVLKRTRQASMSAFELMQKVLEETKCSWLDRLDDLEKEIGMREEDAIAKLLQQSFNVNNLIEEMARKRKQPGDEFLQDIRSILIRYEAAQELQLVDVFPGLDKTLNMWTQKTTALEKAVKNIKESLEKVLQKAKVTLDHKTAHPRLSLYANYVHLGHWQQQVPDNRERFDTKLWLLGCERFTAGRHWWEVEVERKAAEWAVGVAKESVRRKGDIGLNPDEGIWAVGQVLRTGYLDQLELTSFTSPEPTILDSGSACSGNLCWTIRVSLDYEVGCVAFSHAVTGKPIFTFPSASFSGERIYPFFEMKSQGSSLFLR